MPTRSPFRTCKMKGESVESDFQSIALKLGYIVSRPWGDSAPYDFIVEYPHRRNRFSKRTQLTALINLLRGHALAAHVNANLSDLQSGATNGKGTASSRAARATLKTTASAAEGTGRRPKANGQRLRRVQVKSTWTKDRNSYLINAGRTGNRYRYSVARVDILAAHVVPLDVWYIIPIRALRGKKTIAVLSHAKRGSKSRLEKYRENWALLG